MWKLSGQMEVEMADIEVDFTDEEYALIKEAADRNGETVQEFCERAVARFIEDHRGELSA